MSTSMQQTFMPQMANTLSPLELDPEQFDPRHVAPEGPSEAPRLYLVGEAPGTTEAKTGRPFVGPAGKALRNLLSEVGADLASIRISNAVPYRPITRVEAGSIRNRKPTVREIRHFGKAVLADIAHAKPAVIVALGASAATLFDIPLPISEARLGNFLFDGTLLRVTYHPAYLLRATGQKTNLWEQARSDLRRFWNEALEVEQTLQSDRA
jgi:DNA polymerase